MISTKRILWREGSDIWRSPAKLWMSAHHVAMAARDSMGQTLTTGSDPAGTVRTMYVHCTYIVPTVRTMYVHCTYSARWGQNNHLTVADVAAVTFRNQFFKLKNFQFFINFALLTYIYIRTSTTGLLSIMSYHYSMI